MHWHGPDHSMGAAAARKPAAKPQEPLVELVEAKSDTIRLTQDDAASLLGLKLVEVRSAAASEPLRLPGTLALDPNRLIHVHSRFAGEAVSIGQTRDADGKMRPLQYGDRVTRGQLLAIVWSKEIGEKKSELLDASSRLEASRTILERLESLPPGIVAERVIHEARREVEAGIIALARAEQTLRSWRLTEEEIAIIYQELEAIKKDSQAVDSRVEREWAEIEVRAAIDGVIIEKNFNVGDMVETDEDLFKIADLSRLQVVASIYEEDIGAVRALKSSERRWSIDLKSDPTDNHLPGTFDLIGSVIDPAQRTGVLMGRLDNSAGQLAAGQFITATIELPQDPHVVAVPETAIVDEGGSSAVFVEADHGRREYARRNVTVVRRGSGTAYVSGKPADGTLPLLAGERVVTSGVLRLGGELAILRTRLAKRN